MATKILTAAIALMMGLSFSTFAGDNNKGNKEAKASNETKVETVTPVVNNATQSGTAWFPISSPGVRTGDDPINPNQLCSQGEDYCAQLYNLEDGEPTTPVTPEQTRMKPKN